jgi:hypothetical protein
MRRYRQSVFWRALIAAAIIWAAAIPLSELNWSLYDLLPYDAATGAHPQYIAAPVAPLAYGITNWMWRICPGLIEMMVAAAAGIGVFMLLGGRRACLSIETRCGHCAAVLRGLKQARCSRCERPL